VLTSPQQRSLAVQGFGLPSCALLPAMAAPPLRRCDRCIAPTAGPDDVHTRNERPVLASLSPRSIPAHAPTRSASSLGAQILLCYIPAHVPPCLAQFRQAAHLFARWLCLTRRRYALGPTSRVERVRIGGGGRSPDGDRSPWRGDGAAPSARGAWDSFSTTTTSELRRSSPYLGRPLLFLPSSPLAEILEPRHPEASRISQSDTGVARLEEGRGHLCRGG
jgi:hypothetical protein